MGGWISCEYRKRFTQQKKETHTTYVNVEVEKEQPEVKPEVTWIQRSRGFKDLPEEDE
jgi:hypothetical protein